MAMAGRSTAAARCSMPTASASSTSPIVCRSTPRKPTIPRWNPRRCSSVSPPKARRLPRWPRRRKRLDGVGNDVAPRVRAHLSHRERSDRSCDPGEGFQHVDRAYPLTPTLSPWERGRAANVETLMTHPGEQFYPQGVRWDDAIERGTLPDLLSQAAAAFAARPAIEFRDRPISYAELEAMVETAAAAFLRAGYGKGATIALFLGNTPDHPVNFFGALKAGARLVHLSPLDGEIALSHKLSDSGARVLVTSNLSALLPTALKFLDKGLLDRLIVCEDDRWGKAGTPQTAQPDNPKIVTYSRFVDGATKPAQWPQARADDVALLQYTGGTTGLPKGAMLSHGNLTAAVSIYDVWGKPARLERDAI